MTKYSSRISSINTQISSKTSLLNTLRGEIDQLAGKANGTIVDIKNTCIASAGISDTGRARTRNSSTSSNGNSNYEIDSNGNFHYNGYTFIYDKNADAYVYTADALCTESNFTDFMIPIDILEATGSNFIIQFHDKSNKIGNKAKGKFSTDYNNGVYIGTGPNGELPISRIYCIDKGINNIHMEFNQYWAGTSSNLTSSGVSKTNENGCLLFSLINGCPIPASKSYNGDTILQRINHVASDIITSAKKNNGEINRNQTVGNIIADIPYIDLTNADEISNNSAYLIRITEGGTHNVVAVPAGDGKWYLIDSDNTYPSKRHKLLFDAAGLRNIAKKGNQNKASIGISYNSSEIV